MSKTCFLLGGDERQRWAAQRWYSNKHFHTDGFRNF